MVWLELCAAKNRVVPAANFVWCAGSVQNFDAVHDVAIMLDEKMGTCAFDVDVVTDCSVVHVKDVVKGFSPRFIDFHYSAVFLEKRAFAQQHYIEHADALLLTYLLYRTQSFLCYDQIHQVEY